MDYTLVESDQHPGCTVSTYFKMQKGTFLPQTFKPFPDGPRGTSEWGQSQQGWFSLPDRAQRWWPQAAVGDLQKASPSACRQMPPMPSFAKHPQEAREIRGKARVCLVEMLPSPCPPPCSCLCWFYFSAAAAHSCLGNGSGPREAAVGGRSGIWYVFEPESLCPSSQSRQPVGPLSAVFGWGLGWGPQRETLGRRRLSIACCSILGIRFSKSGPRGRWPESSGDLEIILSEC